MASVEDIYVDPSALYALYVNEPASLALGRWRTRLGGAMPITRFGHAELINAIALGRFRGDLSAADYLGAMENVRNDLTAGRLRLVDLLWRSALDRAVALSHEHTAELGTRALDVLHVASALELNARQFVTYDERQAKLAAACRLKVLSP